MHDHCMYSYKQLTGIGTESYEFSHILWSIFSNIFSKMAVNQPSGIIHVFRIVQVNAKGDGNHLKSILKNFKKDAQLLVVHDPFGEKDSTNIKIGDYTIFHTGSFLTENYRKSKSLIYLKDNDGSVYNYSGTANTFNQRGTLDKLSNFLFKTHIKNLADLNIFVFTVKQKNSETALHDLKEITAKNYSSYFLFISIDAVVDKFADIKNYLDNNCELLNLSSVDTTDFCYASKTAIEIFKGVNNAAFKLCDQMHNKISIPLPLSK